MSPPTEVLGPSGIFDCAGAILEEGRQIEHASRLLVVVRQAQPLTFGGGPTREAANFGMAIPTCACNGCFAADSGRFCSSILACLADSLSSFWLRAGLRGQSPASPFGRQETSLPGFGF